MGIVSSHWFCFVSAFIGGVIAGRISYRRGYKAGRWHQNAELIQSMWKERK